MYKKIFNVALLVLICFSLISCNKKENTKTKANQKETKIVGSRTTGIFNDCPPEGKRGDPDLNRLKNRDVPPTNYKTYTVEEIESQLPQNLPYRKDMKNWRKSQRYLADSLANQGVSVEGYLLKIKQEGKESCNCYSKEMHDFHLWLAANPNDNRSKSIVVEISPRVLPDHPNWHVRQINKIIKAKAKVRISGWLMWDPEHPEQIGKTRATLWEIHPIHKIEVFSSGKWREF